MRVAVVLDGSAAVAYAHGFTGVGEILAEILDARDGGEQVVALIPAAGLIAAAAAVAPTDLRRLMGHAAVTIAPTDHTSVEVALHLMAQLFVPVDTAAAVQLALTADAPLLTRHGRLLRASRDPSIAAMAIDIDL